MTMRQRNAEKRAKARQGMGEIVIEQLLHSGWLEKVRNEDDKVIGFKWARKEE